MPITPVIAGPGTEKTLPNGLKIIVKEDHRSPVVTSQVWYKIGASYEHDGTTGISHALEHMMFKGTKRYGLGQFSQIISDNGGDENAFTGKDYTAYFQNLAADRLAIAFELEADRMRNLTLPAAEFAKEIEVIKEERRLRTDDNPVNLATEHFYANAFLLSPYRTPVIGWMTDLNVLSVDQLRTWYRLWYAPNNATLVVVGDIKPEAVFALAEQHFGPLKAEVITPPQLRIEPQQLGIKRITIKIPAKEPYLIMGYKVPVITSQQDDWEPYALEVLSYILSGGDSSRLQRELVRGSQVAASIDTDYSAFSRLPELFTLDGSPAKGHSIAELEASLRQQIKMLKQIPVTEAELARVRNQLIASKVFQQDSIFYQAMEIGLLESVGLDWHLADKYVDKLSAITAAQIQAVANKYLLDDTLTVAVLEPQTMDSNSIPSNSSGVSNVIR
ncbi:peptidase M16 [Achromatium sp. WMS2]|nr:peptidase M16 [Achromatium sp. WMS2]